MSFYSRSLGAVSLGAAAIIGSACLPSQTGDQPDLSGQNLRFTILHTSDIHSRLLQYDYVPPKTDKDLGMSIYAPPYGGVTRLASLINRERAKSDRAVYLDSGDQFEGAPIFNLSTGEPEIRWMSLMQPDAVVIGNHEFDLGARNFAQQYQKWGHYPLLAANYDFSNTSDPTSNLLGDFARPYTIINKNGLRIGIIGMANESSLGSIARGGNSLQIKGLEPNETTRQWVSFIEPQVDLVVILSHMGLTEDQQLITGYDDYFPYWADIDEFFTRPVDPWTLVEPVYPDGTRHVFIPGVRDVDVIMGGHIHVVLDPTQSVVNPNQPERTVYIQHSGSFAKYLGRLDLDLQMPSSSDTPQRQSLGAGIVSHTYHPFPVDAIWCDDEARSWQYQMTTEAFQQAIQPRIAACTLQEDQLTTWLLEPYILNQTVGLNLSNIYAYAPQEILRNNTSNGGDSALGDLTAKSMEVRQAVQAEMAITNTLGIRDDIYAGPITLEEMYNVFPFENTINILYLSGEEVHEMFDFVSARSANRGCQSQAQIAGTTFTMDCAQALLNIQNLSCFTPADCPSRPDEATRSPWQCRVLQQGGLGYIEDNGTQLGICYAEESNSIVLNGEPLDLNAQYKCAVNNYIARGGSGFSILAHNNTRQETGLSLRDSLIGYMQDQCTCNDLNNGATNSSTGLPCATLIDTAANTATVDPKTQAYCSTATAYEQWLKTSYSSSWNSQVGPLLDGTCNCTTITELVQSDGGYDLPDGGLDPCLTPPMPQLCAAPALSVGNCNCSDVLVNNEYLCGHITPELQGFCQDPTSVPVVVQEEDGRIARRTQ